MPQFSIDYIIIIIITIRDILTKDDTFISSYDMYNHFDILINKIDNDGLRGQINNYLMQTLEKDMKKKVYEKLVQSYPEIIDYYIKDREQNKEETSSISNEKVEFSEQLYIEKFKEIINLLESNTDFYKHNPNSFDEALERVRYLKNVIEDIDGYKIFYIKGQPLKREEDFQILYKLTWFASKSDINAEVNNGRGPVILRHLWDPKIRLL